MPDGPQQIVCHVWRPALIEAEEPPCDTPHAYLSPPHVTPNRQGTESLEKAMMKQIRHFTCGFVYALVTVGVGVLILYAFIEAASWLGNLHYTP